MHRFLALAGLREARGHVGPPGLCALDRRVPSVGEAYRTPIAAWPEVPPGQGRCLTIPRASG